MKRPAPRDTICALATPEGTGGIAVIRLSGPRTLRILDRCFRPPRPSRQASGTVRPRWLRARGETLDQVLLAVFRAPHSYTGEELAEVSCHGGPALARAALDEFGRLGCRPAAPGEFTRRAVLSGKLTLSQAEAVLELTAARTTEARRRALRAYGGAVSRFAARLGRELDALLAEYEYRIGFEDENSPAPGTAERRIARLVAELDRAVADGTAARRLERGLSVAIIGRANVGKSSLFNALLATERAIVDRRPGTTRDRVEATLLCGETAIRLTDTAGVPARCRTRLSRAAAGQTTRAIDEADALIAVFDASRPAGPADRAVLASCAGRPCLLVTNKSDLPARLDAAALPGPALRVSCRTGRGVAAVRRRILGWTAPRAAGALTTVERHLRAFASARDSLAAAKGSPGLDSAALDIRQASAMLAQVDALPSRTDILDEVFVRFCVGK